MERARDLFWRQGYHAAPMPQLTSRLGIGSGSLHAAFGSREGLYARALKRYCDGLVAMLAEEVDSASGIRTTLRRLLLAIAAADAEDPERGWLTLPHHVHSGLHVMGTTRADRMFLEARCPGL